MLRYLSRNQKHVTKKFIDIVIRDPGGLAFQKKVKILLRCPFKLLDADHLHGIELMYQEMIIEELFFLVGIILQIMKSKA